MSNKHQFALYVPALTSLATKLLFHRAVQVLRLKIGDQLILFDRQQHVTAEITAIQKRDLTLKLVGRPVANHSLQPQIIVGLPLLKREALSAALYSCVELGATQVQLIVTEKSEKAGAKFSAHQLAHLEQIMIAAAEQSKNFCLPALLAPISLPEFLAPFKLSAQLRDQMQIFFDPTGVPVCALLPKLTAAPKLSLLWGPEGDLTATEKVQVAAAGFTACKLTHTILRASQAVAVGLGLMRSLI